ncbi:hypothetical protein C8J56DRAFT_911988 [Mycena floridula]|nr:hypothetical protein C8J56DRAFT_911988 [Mycena floridula]
MVEFHCPEGTLPEIPNISIPRFLLDSQSPSNAARKPESPWLVEDATGRHIGLDELRSRTFGLANALVTRYGIREDDVVLLFSRNHVDYPVAIWAAHRLGAVITGANPDFASNELQYQMESSKACLVLAHPESLTVATSAARAAGISLDRIVLFNVQGQTKHPKYPTIEKLVWQGLSLQPQFVEPDIDARTKLAFLSYSSGTTGKPKAVAIPHIAVITNVIQMAVHHKVGTNYTAVEEQRYRPGDVCIAVLPFYHIYGLVLNLHFILFNGMSLVIVPKFNFVEMLKSITLHRISHLIIVPPMALLLCKHPAVKNYDLSIVRFIMIGAAPLSDEIHNQLCEQFPNAAIGQAYGMTELCTAVTAWPTSQKRGTSGSGGQLMPGVIAKVVKPDGTLANHDEPGELIVWTPSRALGYHNNEEATKETFVNGWVKTGDEVKIDRQGEVWVLDRIKEIMKVRGFQVAPAEVEGCILDHPDVSDCCVVGVPHEFSGEVPMAFVSLSAAAAEKVRKNPRIVEDIKASVSKHVADNKVSYKHLAGGVEIVAVIPRNPSGKLLRRLLRDQAKQLAASRQHKPKL